MPYYPQPMPSPYGSNPARPLPTSLAQGQSTARPPVIRGQAPENPAPPLLRAPVPTLRMPAPEELGIKLVKNDIPLDWNKLRQQLDDLGASSFQLERQGEGFHFACQVRGRSIEGKGSSEAEAVRVAMAKLQAKPQ